jgi:hypothetical protein
MEAPTRSGGVPIPQPGEPRFPVRRDTRDQIRERACRLAEATVIRYVAPDERL